jgi:hypothetical protein
MANLSGVVRQLNKEREHARRQIGRLEAALKVLGGLAKPGRTGRRRMSAAGRARIAAAQRARWARVRRARRAA